MKYTRQSSLFVLSAVFLFLLSFNTISHAKEYSTHIAELPNTNKKMLNSRVYVYESNIPGYYQYINGRYAFTIDFPQNFTIAFLPANSDGATFSLPDGSAKLSVSGSHNTARFSLDDYYYFTMEGIKEKKGYSAKGKDWFVLTWKQDGKIFYTKSFVSDSLLNSFTLSCGQLLAIGENLGRVGYNLFKQSPGFAFFGQNAHEHIVWQVLSKLC